jgi:hypothetical protein
MEMEVTLNEEQLKELEKELDLQRAILEEKTEKVKTNSYNLKQELLDDKIS